MRAPGADRLPPLECRVSELDDLLARNRAWAARVEAAEPGFFARLAAQQAPRYLWIGCSDSRVPANQIVDLLPGEIFVHRNVGNLVHHTDLNLLSVLQYAIEVLAVRHVIVCGHYGCGAVRAALEGAELGLIDNWLRGLHGLARTHRCDDPAHRLDALCEENVRVQVRAVCDTTVVRSAWQRGQGLTVHGWIYGIGDGLVRDLRVSRDGLGGAADSAPAR
jgi:carbonic anhydrase